MSLPVRIGPALLASGLAWFVAGCASVPPPAIGHGPRTASTVSPAGAAIAVNRPDPIGAYELEMVDESPDPDVGTLLRYRSTQDSHSTVDAFVYLLGHTDDVEAVLADFDDGFADHIKQAVAAGHYVWFQSRDAGRLVVDYDFGRRAGSWQVFHVGLPGDPIPFVSVAHLHYRSPFGIKLRASRPGIVAEKALRDELAAFARELLPRLNMRRADCEREPEAEASGAPGAANELGLLEQAMRGCGDLDAIRQRIDARRKQAIVERNLGEAR